MDRDAAAGRRTLRVLHRKTIARLVATVAVSWSLLLLQLPGCLLSTVTAQAPRFAHPIGNVTVAVGRDASLPCVVENLGSYKVAWVHIDRQMIITIHRQIISRIPRYTMSYDNANTWTLHVTQVQQEDRGYYMCQINSNPMISQVGYLQVVVPPNILDIESTPSSVAVRENQHINMTCRADGFPLPKIIWRREDGEAITVERKKKGKQSSAMVYDGEVLPLTKVSRNEMGAYLCIATNGVPPSVSKRIILDVEFSPVIWVPNQLVGAPAGTDVTIDCNTEAHPKAIIYWVYNVVMVLPSKKFKIDYSENSYRAHMKLTIKNLQPSDFGNYRCISKNSLGETEGSIRVYEIPMPSSPSKQITHAQPDPKENSIIQRNDTGKSSTLPELVYPMRSAESHHGNGGGGGSNGGSGSGSGGGGGSGGMGASANAAVDRKAVGGAGGAAVSSAAAAAGGTIAIGQSLFYTDFPPKEYGSSAGSLPWAMMRHTIVHSLLVPLLLYCY